jgi:hypothetical protein
MENTTQQGAFLPVDITFALVSLKCTSFVMTPYADARKVPILPDLCEFLINVNFTVIKEKQQVQIIVESKMYEKLLTGTQGEELLTMIATGIFHVHNFDGVISLSADKKTFQIPTPLIEIFNSLVISSARGMLSVKLEKTIYDNIVYPLIDMKALIPKPAHFA